MLYLIPLLPFLGFLTNGLWYLLYDSRNERENTNAIVTGGISSLAIFGSFIVAVFAFFELSSLPEDSRSILESVFSWISVGEFKINLEFRLDQLSSLFVLVITGVGTLIHVYSIGYMAHDESPGKYFSYLNLFCFAMLVLVMGSSLPVMFFGWEGVGLCSYLLIGFWYQDNEKASAGKKAFIVNRVGDFGFLLGMFLIYSSYGTLNFAELAEVVPGASVTVETVTLICLFLFLGCAGKSAQIPLYVWLPDAMAGPTPVSALIHAATMVTSGIYLVARLGFMYELAPIALQVVAWVGATTAFFAATIALTQTDIKKVLAYSTVSQLGYMFLACGVGAFGAGVFHVVTHAFFKALLFLGAGSVILGMHHEQNIMKMGGLAKKMPKTFWVFFIGTFAIAGIPPFSGFFSKDEILWLSFSSANGSTALWFVGTVTAVMTAFYMTRLLVLTFLGKPRFTENQEHKVHESPGVVVIPLIVLAVLSAVAGFWGIPHSSWIHHWLLPIIPDPSLNPDVAPALEWVLMGISVIGAGLGMFFAYRLYQNLDKVNLIQKKWTLLHRALINKWYVDELYEALFVRPIHKLSEILWTDIDVGVIDRIVVGISRVTVWAGRTIRVAQSGSLQIYTIAVMVGVVVTLGYFIYGMV